MVCALQYLAMTRLDVAYSVHVVSQYMHAPCNAPLHAIKCIFRNLQGTLNHGLQLQATISPSLIVAYSDADWPGAKTHVALPLVTWSSLGLLLSPGVPRNKLQFQIPPLKLNTKPLLTSLLKLLDS